ncbi:ABC-2 type transporter [Acidovorax delafieldii 2AN]|uniref:Transport permease protein n=1 Tax=Acidovorax delafieldii 2AN TaxID=573060 RepID=C5T0N8_ACIDE|nr:ABC transporter permease [Acidovorax delafieldii]EER61943.1 ABC-2 type transporter [Acidovorax delafieldii 2AN]
MRHFSATPREMLATLWRHRDLINASTKREVLGRYRGSSLGLLWSFFNPVFMLIIYTFVFSVVFKARWSGGGESKTEFALVLFSGLIVFNLFSECINRAPGLILSNVNYVKKVVFPLEILPFVAFLSALFHAAISLCVWLSAYVIFIGTPPITIFYLPLILIPFVMFIMGISWVLTSLGVYLRDAGQFVGILTAVLMFLSPVFYPITSLPESYRYLLYFNPLTLVIEQFRAVLYFGKAPYFSLLAVYWVATFFAAWLGFAWFQKTRKGFADVL